MHVPSLHLLPQLFLWACRGRKIATMEIFLKGIIPFILFQPPQTHPAGQPALQTNPCPAAFPVFVQGRWAQTQCSAGRLTWGPLPGAGWETAQGALCRFYFSLGTCACKELSQFRRFSPNPATITKITLTPQFFLPSRVG